MKIGILSGKGGTGKTLLAVNLAALAEKSTYIDCDVEEPNGLIYFKPEIISTETVTVPIPKVDPELCDGAGKCVDFCRYNALAYSGTKLLIFPEICHSCGGCMLVCPNRALSEIPKSIGKITLGKRAEVTVLAGELNIGVASGVPIIAKLLEKGQAYQKDTFIDSPPGTGCSVMESIKDADYCLVVTEPSIFGAHNLAMVVKLLKLFAIPFSVILNKDLNGENPSLEYCQAEGIPVIGRIPYDNDLGKINSEGKILVEENPKWRKVFEDILEKIMKEVAHEGAYNIKR